MEKQRFILAHDVARQRAAQAALTLPQGWIAEYKAPTRNLEQNALMWSLLAELSRQVEWYGQHLTDEEWKDVLSAALKKQKVVPGIDGGFVVCGQRTSKMSKAEFSELIELIHAFGAQHGVNFNEARAA